MTIRTDMASDEPGSSDPEKQARPEPVTETPASERFCDIVMTGGVASGVVYPWAVVELARHYNFKSIGGTSVGAMAAVLAAAAEYGRRTGNRDSFEVLRQIPIKLAEPVENGKTIETRMLSLFQPSEHGERLFRIFVAGINASYRNEERGAGVKEEPETSGSVIGPVLVETIRQYWRPAIDRMWAYLPAAMFFVLCSTLLWFASQFGLLYPALKPGQQVVEFMIKLCGLGCVAGVWHAIFLFDSRVVQRVGNHKSRRTMAVAAIAAVLLATLSLFIIRQFPDDQRWTRHLLVWLPIIDAVFLIFCALRVIGGKRAESRFRFVISKPIVFVFLSINALATSKWAFQSFDKSATSSVPDVLLPILLGFAILSLAAIVATLYLLSIFYSIYCDISRGIISNGFGLCRGGTQSGDRKNRPALTEWLHAGIQQAAGLTYDQPPLTFRDLWNAPDSQDGYPVREDPRKNPDARAINLEVITSNLSNGRPFRLPIIDREARFFYRRSELLEYFPVAVLDSMVANSQPYQQLSPSEPEEGKVNTELPDLLELPGAELPIVVAARLSLSFPVLFSAVPLYAIDFSYKVRADRTVTRCWFSDGGLCSNFPIHLFDAAIPRWPTFGIWLTSAMQGFAKKPERAYPAAWIPNYHLEGRGNIWQDIQLAEGGSGSLLSVGEILKFIGLIFSTSKDWADVIALMLPHVRTRVARFALEKHEGQLNIAMSSETILNMAGKYGTKAGKDFVERYILESRGPVSPKFGNRTAWQEHLYVRTHVLLGTLDSLLKDYSQSLRSSSHSIPIAELLRMEGRPLRVDPTKDNEDPSSEPLKEPEIEELIELLEKLDQLALAF